MPELSAPIIAVSGSDIYACTLFDRIFLVNVMMPVVVL